MTWAIESSNQNRVDMVCVCMHSVGVFSMWIICKRNEWSHFAIHYITLALYHPLLLTKENQCLRHFCSAINTTVFDARHHRHPLPPLTIEKEGVVACAKRKQGETPAFSRMLNPQHSLPANRTLRRHLYHHHFQRINHPTPPWPFHPQDFACKLPPRQSPHLVPIWAQPQS